MKAAFLSGRRRFDRERKTIRVMIELYCRGNHGSRGQLCAECQELLAYSMEKMERCRYRFDKPVCSRCTIHCYKPDMRRQIRQVMRSSGPRILLSHPLLTVLHYIDSLIKRAGK